MESESIPAAEGRNPPSLSAVYEELERKIDALITLKKGDRWDVDLAAIVAYCDKFSGEFRVQSPRVAARIADLGQSLRSCGVQSHPDYYRIYTEMGLLRGAITA